MKAAMQLAVLATGTPLVVQRPDDVADGDKPCGRSDVVRLNESVYCWVRRNWPRFPGEAAKGLAALPWMGRW
jgi:hypothetical protein